MCCWVHTLPSDRANGGQHVISALAQATTALAGGCILLGEVFLSLLAPFSLDPLCLTVHRHGTPRRTCLTEIAQLEKCSRTQ